MESNKVFFRGSDEFYLHCQWRKELESLSYKQKILIHN